MSDYEILIQQLEARKANYLAAKLAQQWQTATDAQKTMLLKIYGNILKRLVRDNA